MRLLTTLAVAAVAVPTLAAAQIVPRDGTWTVTPAEPAIADACPAEVRPALEQMAGQMQQTSTFEAVWNGKFDPSQDSVADGGGEGVEWNQVDDTTWEGTLKMGPDGPEIGTMQMKITDPGAIDTSTIMAVDDMMAAQGQDVPGIDGCEVTVDMAMTHDG